MIQEESGYSALYELHTATVPSMLRLVPDPLLWLALTSTMPLSSQVSSFFAEPSLHDLAVRTLLLSRLSPESGMPLIALHGSFLDLRQQCKRRCLLKTLTRFGGQLGLQAISS